MIDWKQKILAHLRFPPESAAHFGHTAQRQLGEYAERIPDGTGRQQSPPDSVAGSMDSLILPDEEKLSRANLSNQRREPVFCHPFAGRDTPVRFPEPVAVGDTISGALDELPPTAPATQFWQLWRAWLPLSVTRAGAANVDPSLPAYLPVDARKPDATLWHYHCLASALESTRGSDNRMHPAFFLFEVDPNQDCVSQARTGRDLWSGSFLLSWMMAQAIKTVTDQLGPDSVIFPWLRGQPLYDWLHREQGDPMHKDGIGFESMSFLKTLGWAEPAGSRRALIPHLPHRFLALVPAGFDPGPTLDQFKSTPENSAWRQVCQASWSFLNAACPLSPAQGKLWEFQTAHFWQVAWHIWPWQEPATALLDCEQIPASPASRLALAHAVAQAIPAEHQEHRSNPLEPLRAWSAHWSMVAHRLAARRQTRDFSAWPAHPKTLKASLAGDEQAIADSTWISQARQSILLKHLFPKDDQVGAFTLINRVWPEAVLKKRGFDPDPAAPAVSLTARGAPGQRPCGWLVLDADDIRKWLSGEKGPPIESCLAPETAHYFRHGLKGVEVEEWLASTRPVSGAHHLQFSEALANFSLYAVPRIVEYHRGQLVYAVGDTVLAQVPVEEAMACARGLRLAFQGSAQLAEVYPRQFKPTGIGFFHLTCPLAAEPSWPLLVPGPKATISAGLALGDTQTPLPEMGCGAWAALKRAKARPVPSVWDRKTGQLILQPNTGWNRDALALTWFRRSGEPIYWGAKFDSPALDLFQFLHARPGANPGAPHRANSISRQLAQRLATRLSRYAASQSLSPELVEIAGRELAWAACQPPVSLSVPEQETLLQFARAYLDHLLKFSGPEGESTQAVPRTLNEFVNLFLVADLMAPDTN